MKVNFRTGDYLKQTFKDKDKVIYGKVLGILPDDKYKILYKSPNSDTVNFSILDVKAWSKEDELPFPAVVQDISVPLKIRELLKDHMPLNEDSQTINRIKMLWNHYKDNVQEFAKKVGETIKQNRLSLSTDKNWLLKLLKDLTGEEWVLHGNDFVIAEAKDEIEDGSQTDLFSEATGEVLKTTLLKDILVTKSGYSIKAGTLIYVWPKEGSNDTLYISTEPHAEKGNRAAIYARNASKYSNKFMKEPSIATLEKWVDEGIAKTVLGNKTEPDGTDQYGFPSWLLALGMI